MSAIIERAMIPSGFPTGPAAVDASSFSPAQPQTQSLSDSVAHHLELYFTAHQGRLPPAGLYDRILAEIERPLIERCLIACQGNQIKAADLLGLNRNTLRKKIRDLGITVRRGSETALRSVA